MSLLIFLTYSNTWFLTWLSVLHCVKIDNFSHPLFLHLKMKTSKVIPWLILGSALTAFMTSVPFAWTFYNIRVQNVSLNITAGASTLRMHFIYLFPMLALQVTLPFSMMSVSSLLLIRSLWRHTVRLESRAGSFRNPRLDAHFRAIKFVVISLLTYLCFSVLATVNAPGIVTLDSISHEVLKCLFIFFPTLHSIVLIHANSKLSLAFQRILQHVMCSKITQTSSTQHR
ncbi:taste receptor type 2 member 41-like [Ambystoma mexicanum]|uniref:taste receptor type 2 member 41-like n=1 Tax=Ambystoma mexicanum TaxID=8296 RepID=UPI0037E9365A